MISSSTSRLTPVPDSSSSSPASPPSSKALLTVEEALKSCIRAWLVARDSVIWDLNMSGLDPDTESRLVEVSADDAQPGIEQMNSLRVSALYFADKLATKRQSAEDVLTIFTADLLKSESPALSLHVDSVPDSF